MAAHAAWKGYLRLSLVSLPVRAYSASNASKSEIHLNQLHDKCKSRIRYKKTCPIHGEVANDEIVMGYEFDKDQYVIVDTEEVSKLRTEAEKHVRIEGFIPAQSIEPVYYSGRSYFLAPDGAVGQRPYVLIRDSMIEEGLHAIAQAVISNREQLVMLWPIDQLIAMTVLEYKNQVKDPVSFRDEIVNTPSDAQEQKLARQLIEGMVQESFDLGKYRDDYNDKLTRLIESKVQGQELVTPPKAEAPTVINLMDALRKSMSQVKSATGAADAASSEEKPKEATRPRKAAPKKAARRKSG